jgi:hypothetical protein
MRNFRIDRFTSVSGSELPPLNPDDYQHLYDYKHDHLKETPTEDMDEEELLKCLPALCTEYGPSGADYLRLHSFMSFQRDHPITKLLGNQVNDSSFSNTKSTNELMENLWTLHKERVVRVERLAEEALLRVYEREAYRESKGKGKAVSDAAEGDGDSEAVELLFRRNEGVFPPRPPTPYRLSDDDEAKETSNESFKSFNLVNKISRTSQPNSIAQKLPHEILSLIFTYMMQSANLYFPALTCRSWSAVAIPMLWEKVLLSSPVHVAQFVRSTIYSAAKYNPFLEPLIMVVGFNRDPYLAHEQTEKRFKERYGATVDDMMGMWADADNGAPQQQQQQPQPPQQLQQEQFDGHDVPIHQPLFEPFGVLAGNQQQFQPNNVQQAQLQQNIFPPFGAPGASLPLALTVLPNFNHSHQQQQQQQQQQPPQPQEQQQPTGLDFSSNGANNTAALVDRMIDLVRQFYGQNQHMQNPLQAGGPSNATGLSTAALLNQQEPPIAPTAAPHDSITATMEAAQNTLLASQEYIAEALNSTAVPILMGPISTGTGPRGVQHDTETESMNLQDEETEMMDTVADDPSNIEIPQLQFNGLHQPVAQDQNTAWSNLWGDGQHQAMNWSDMLDVPSTYDPSASTFSNAGNTSSFASTENNGDGVWRKVLLEMFPYLSRFQLEMDLLELTEPECWRLPAEQQKKLVGVKNVTASLKEKVGSGSLVKSLTIPTMDPEVNLIPVLNFLLPNLQW